MYRSVTFGLLAILLGTVVFVSATRALEGEKPKFTIKEVMEKAHKNKLVNKVAEGKGTKEEAAELVVMYKALGENKPPKGELEDWKKKTAELLAAAQDVADAKAGGGERLTKAVNCGACHGAHKK